MNIFVLSRNPVLAAQMQCDKHVVKMVLETAQLLCSPFPAGAAPYQRSHYHHPAAVWARTSQGNYRWLITHGLALCAEYKFRYGREHKSRAVILWCRQEVRRLQLPRLGLTPFVQVMDKVYQSTNPVAAYRNYYRQKKRRIARWRRRPAPKWWPKN